MRYMERIKNLEQKGILRIILFLHKNHMEELRQSTIQKAVGVSNDAYYNSRNKLIDLKIIEKIDDKYKTVSYFKLTEKGQKIAEQLQKINELIL